MREGIRSVADFVGEIKQQIRMGLVQDDLKRYVVRNAAAHELDTDEAILIMEDVINNFSDYNLICKIKRSKLAKNISTKDCVLVDSKYKTVEVVDEQRIQNVLSRKFDWNDLIVNCKFDYNPYDSRVFFHDENENQCLNTYTPPTWLKTVFYSNGNLEINKSENFPKIYKKFLRHLVNEHEPSYNYILDWLSNMLHSRNLCILTVIGDQGIGKGVLGQIMKALVGASNYHHGSGKLFSSNFNSQIKNKKLVYLDELKIKNELEEEKLKLLINDDLEVERKGVDVEQVKNYASFYLSSNSDSAVKLYQDDRRFSVVEVTTNNLNKIMNQEEMRSMFEDESLIQEFAQYLWHRQYDKEEINKVFKTKRTEEIRESALYDWQDFFINEYCVKMAGKFVPINGSGNDTIKEQLETMFGTRNPPGRDKLTQLSKIIPGKFRVKKAKNAEGIFVWGVEIFDNNSNDINK